MNTNEAIDALVRYGIERELINEEDRMYITNSILSALGLNSYEPQTTDGEHDIEEILNTLAADAISRRVVNDNIEERDLFDTKLMGIMTPFPREVISKFWIKYMQSPKSATDWYYGFSQDTNYIRKYRIKKDIKWQTETEYGNLDITINLSKPEKDPKAIAAAKEATQSGYPKCQLCVENEGYAGRIGHPARENLRLIPLNLAGQSWFFQYSPYVYYNEHCIALNGEHVPMKIDRTALEKMFDFIKIFPHYFIGSNADLPIVGGSILSHDHFQGGNYTFAMERADIETNLVFTDYEDINAGIVKWPMSVIRLNGANLDRIINLSVKILDKWRNYTDENVFIYAQTGGKPHNTITPIARMKNGNFEIDLVLRNNITTEDRPLGYFHPNPSLHHIKKENIGLIEVMGLAVLPSRLKKEITALETAIIMGKDLNEDEFTAKHAEWANKFLRKYDDVDISNIDSIVKKEIGLVFLDVLKDAGVYKRDDTGKNAFIKFIWECGGNESRN